MAGDKAQTPFLQTSSGFYIGDRPTTEEWIHYKFLAPMRRYVNNNPCLVEDKYVPIEAAVKRGDAELWCQSFANLLHQIVEIDNLPRTMTFGEEVELLRQRANKNLMHATSAGELTKSQAGLLLSCTSFLDHINEPALMLNLTDSHVTKAILAYDPNEEPLNSLLENLHAFACCFVGFSKKVEKQHTLGMSIYFVAQVLIHELISISQFPKGVDGKAMSFHTLLSALMDLLTRRPDYELVINGGKPECVNAWNSAKREFPWLAKINTSADLDMYFDKTSDLKVRYESMFPNILTFGMSNKDRVVKLYEMYYREIMKNLQNLAFKLPPPDVIWEGLLVPIASSLQNSPIFDANHTGEIIMRHMDMNQLEAYANDFEALQQDVLNTSKEVSLGEGVGNLAESEMMEL